MITGATSGFGAATARRFAKAGWRVVATGRRAEHLQTLVDEFGPQTVAAAPFDMRDAAAMESALSALPEPFRGIDVLMNNAGLALGTAPAPQAKLEDWLTMNETNVAGLVTITHKLLPTLIERKGLIVNLSSVAAIYPSQGANVYGATKAFVRQFSLDLRTDLHGTGVRVTSLEPGFAQTEFTLVRTSGDQAASDAFYQGFQPLTAQDIAEAAFWVASLPPHININQLELMPVSQYWAGYEVDRDTAA
jgi:serine 3-dehydrogenase